jgi:hypothetical protein
MTSTDLILLGQACFQIDVHALNAPASEASSEEDQLLHLKVA